MYNPVPGSVVTSGYLGGFRSTGGHSGIDFAAPKGTPIRAVTSGTVISVGNGGAYGNLIKVRQFDGSIAYYAHMSGFNVRRGDRVSRGSVLGRVGNTGNVRGRNGGYHLHFEVRVNGSPTNPMAWLNSGDAGRREGAGGSITTGRNTYTTSTRDNRALLEDLNIAPPPRQAMATMGGGFLSAEEELPQTDDLVDRTPLDLDTARLGLEERFDRRSDWLEQPAMPLRIPTSQIQRVSPPPPVRGGNAFERLIGAIRGQESGGNYRIVNRSSGALGAYQIMPGNISSWSRAALGYSISPQQFLRDARIQDRIARYQLGQYYRKYGAAGAALAWYAGEGALKYSQSAKNRSQGAYPSMNDYVRQVLRRAGLA